MDDKSYLAELLGYLKTNFKNTNGNQSYGIYGAPKSTVKVDNDTPNMGYQMLRNSDIYINPKKNPGQVDSLNTLFHEAAHVQQPRLSQLFNFLDPSYRAVSRIDFPDYNWKNMRPGAEEVLATMRAEEAMLPAGKTIYDDSMGQYVMGELKKTNPDKSEQQLKLMLDRGMFPGRNFAYPGK